MYEATSYTVLDLLFSCLYKDVMFKQSQECCDVSHVTPAFLERKKVTTVLFPGHVLNAVKEGH